MFFVAYPAGNAPFAYGINLPPILHDLDGVSHNGIAGTEDNFMALSADGLPKDSGFNAGDFEADLSEQVVVKSSSSSAVLDDKFKTIEYQNSTNDYTFTIEPDSTTDFPVGSWFVIGKTGLGDITIARGGGVVFRGASGNVNIKLSGEDGFSVYISKRSANTWLYSGSFKDV